MLAPTGIHYGHAWQAALNLTYAYGAIIARVARELVRRRELIEDQFLELVGGR